MQKKRILLWVLVSCISVAIVLLSVIAHFVFKLRTVDVEFRSRLLPEQTQLEPNVREKIKSYFDYGENIVLMNFDETVAEIEKDIPYVKINQIIKSFPNIVRVYISERIPKFIVKNEAENFYVLDGDFKILKEISPDDPETKLLTLIEADGFEVHEEVGEFVQQQIFVKKILTDVLGGVYRATESYSVAHSISVKADENGITSIVVTMRNNASDDGRGCMVEVSGEDRLQEKIYYGVSAYLQEVSAEDFVNDPSTVITVYYEDGTFKAVKSTVK